MCRILRQGWVKVLELTWVCTFDFPSSGFVFELRYETYEVDATKDP